MKRNIATYTTLLLYLFCFWCNAQGTSNDLTAQLDILANSTDYPSNLLMDMELGTSDSTKVRLILAKAKSWDGHYEDARGDFNRITSIERKNVAAWEAAIKNELFANNNATALGLSYKALYYLKENSKIEALRDVALSKIDSQEYPAYTKALTIADEPLDSVIVAKDSVAVEVKEQPKESIIPKNSFGIDNSVTVFNEVFDAMIFSSISYKRETKFGSIIPTINYSNRFNTNGVQFNIDLYPKISKLFYGYLNYGYSNASIYPNHRVGGDLYANLPHAIEVSAGMRFIDFDATDVTIFTNSIGHYRGNYYFSLRSYLTPSPDNLLSVSGNLLVRKYLKDAVNYIGISGGMGFSPELQQLRDGDNLLSETLLFIESQNLRLEYQFTAKKSPNIFNTNIGVTRQEFVFNTGNFFWALSAGLSYQVKF